MGRKPQYVKEIMNSIEKDIHSIKKTISEMDRFEKKVSSSSFDRAVYKDKKLDCTITVEGNLTMGDVSVVDVSAPNGDYKELCEKL